MTHHKPPGSQLWCTPVSMSGQIWCPGPRTRASSFQVGKMVGMIHSIASVIKSSMIRSMRMSLWFTGFPPVTGGSYLLLNAARAAAQFWNFPIRKVMTMVPDEPGIALGDILRYSGLAAIQHPQWSLIGRHMWPGVGKEWKITPGWGIGSGPLHVYSVKQKNNYCTFQSGLEQGPRSVSIYFYKVTLYYINTTTHYTISIHCYKHLATMTTWDKNIYMYIHDYNNYKNKYNIGQIHQLQVHSQSGQLNITYILISLPISILYELLWWIWWNMTWYEMLPLTKILYYKPG